MKVLKSLLVVLFLIFLLTTCASVGETAGGTADSAEESSAEESAPEEPIDDKKVDSPAITDSESEKLDGAKRLEEESPSVEATTLARGAESGSSDEEGLFIEEDIAPEPAEGAGEKSARPRSSTTGRNVPSASGLKAGFADDNRQYGYFVRFLDEFKDVPHFELSVRERILLSVIDSEGKAMANAGVEVYSGNSLLAKGKTVASGLYQFNPSEFGSVFQSFRATIRAEGVEKEIAFLRSGERNQEIQIDLQRRIPSSVPLDILFILDTTGSMGEEIYRLKTTIELIHLNLSSLTAKPDVRFGMILYKDEGDEYDTKVVPLTGSLSEFQEALNLVEASGGGDTPEDLQAALAGSIDSIAWNENGIRLAFIITDAPPHLDYDQQFTYADASRAARERAIKYFSVGTGGLDITGEYILRQISQYTLGKYIFLTYGEAGESEGAQPGSVSHHTGSNYQTDKLEAIIIRFAKEELSYLTDLPLDIEEPFFSAAKIESEEREDTLKKLFDMAIDQLNDYATIELTSDTAAAILPFEPAIDSIAVDAEYFTEQMIFASTQNSAFTLVERKNLQRIIEEQKLQLSGLTEEERVIEIGKILNAEILITGTLYKKESFELFLKMLRVESGEVLSVTKAIIDQNLGISG